jgi:hypothetical protein
VNPHLPELAREADRLDFTVVAVAVSEYVDGRPTGGIAVVLRDECPLPGRDHAVLRWARREGGGATFYSGDYDLTRAGALRELATRVR